MRTIVIETRGEFVERHGGREIMYDKKAGLWLLPDGASITHNSRGEDFLHEPPADQKELLTARRNYHKAWQFHLSGAFNKLKQALLGDSLELGFNWDAAKLGGLKPSGDGIADLKRLRDEVQRHREAAAKINAEIEALPEVRALREQQERDRRLQAEQAAAQARLVMEIQSISLDPEST